MLQRPVRPFPTAAALFAALLLPAFAATPRCSAQDEEPHDTPAPLMTAQAARERVQQALGQPDNATIARYLAADAAHRPAVLGTLLKSVDVQLSQVQSLQTLLHAVQADPAAAGMPPSERRELADQAAQLGALEQRLVPRQLVLQLGALKYADRAAAAEQLRQLGRRAFDELTWGSCSEDPEIADACLRLLVQLRGRGFVGISFSMIPPALSTSEAAEKHLPFVGGVSVEQVIDGQAGEKAGLQPGDVIIGLGPKRITNFSDLLRAVAILGPGFSGQIRYVREGKTLTSHIELKLNSEQP